MLKIAAMGPIVTQGFGMVRECVECGGALTSAGEQACTGFGPGCLGFRQNRREDSTDRADKDVRLSFGNARSTFG